MTDSQSLYVSTPIIKIEDADNSASMNAFMKDILQISVEESLHLPGMFTLVLNNPYAPGDTETKPWQHDRLVQIGKSVKIGFIASTTEAPEFDEERQDYIIEGEITAIETHFTSSTQAPIVIRGYDVSHRLQRGRYNRSFQNYTDSDIVQLIAEEVEIDIGELEPSGDPHEYVFQENQTNMEFLRGRAARIGFELFVRDGKLYFRKPQASESLQLQWLRDIQSFRVRVTSAEQVSSVEVRSWDYSQKQAIVSTTQTEQVITETDNGKGKDTSQKFGRNSPLPKMIVVDKPVSSIKEADVMAQSIFNELGGEFVCADARAPGDPRLRVGKVVRLNEMGRYDGSYYITASRHLYYQGVYTTEFTVRGLRGGSMLDTLSPSTRLKPGQTLLVGIVTDNKDPKGWGRVRVKFPTLNPESDGSGHASYWARVVGMGAGNHRGFDCLPEINDEVLVAFEHGDIHRPYVIGGVWNGKDTPPENVEDTIDKGKVRLRTFKTRTGHLLQFVEEAKNNSQDGIYIQTSRGHKIRLNDSDRSVEITTASNQKIRLDGSSISVTSTGNINIQAAGNINLTPGLGQVAVAGDISCRTLVTGAIFTAIGTGPAVNLGQTVATLQTQIQQNTNTEADIQSQLQQNAREDAQRTQAIADLQRQLQQANTPPKTTQSTPQSNTPSASSDQSAT